MSARSSNPCSSKNISSMLFLPRRSLFKPSNIHQPGVSLGDDELPSEEPSNRLYRPSKREGPLAQLTGRIPRTIKTPLPNYVGQVVRRDGRMSAGSNTKAPQAT